MEKFYHKIYDANTGEETLREYTEEETAQVYAARANHDLLQAEAAEKEATRQALLDKLGITADEAKLLLG